MTPVGSAANVLRASVGAPQDALIRLLDDLAAVVLQASASVYTAKPLPGVSGSVGQHVRHVLDHVTSLVTARPYGSITYDARERGTSIETDRSAALRAVLRLKPLVTGLTDDVLDSPVVVSALLARGHEPDSARSTFRRELFFVIDHTIHHQALIATLLAIADEGVPDGFGFAPSTPGPVSS